MKSKYQILSAALFCIALSPSVHASKVACDKQGRFDSDPHVSVECTTGHISIDENHYIYADVVSTRNTTAWQLTSAQVPTEAHLRVYRHIPFMIDPVVISENFVGSKIIKKRQTYGSAKKFQARVTSGTFGTLKYMPYVRVFLMNDKQQ